MIRCRLLEMMGRRGIRFMSRLSDETGINRRTLAVLAENKMARYDSDVLERLCAFFECQPGDLLEYTDGEGATLSRLRDGRPGQQSPEGGPHL
ncbi:MAG TPA: helix-turn-helix transcriptional regulator [Myxococcales bacterium]|jgi:putative transcriptional regulator